MVLAAPLSEEDVEKHRGFLFGLMKEALVRRVAVLFMPQLAVEVKATGRAETRPGDSPTSQPKRSQPNRK